MDINKLKSAAEVSKMFVQNSSQQASADFGFGDILAQAQTDFQDPISSQVPNLSAEATFPKNAFPPANINFNDDVYVSQLLQEDLIDPLGGGNEATPEFLPENVNEEGLRTSKLEVTPFQFFLDKSVEFLEKVSALERRGDQLMEAYARGEISIEEMTNAKVIAGTAVSFTVTMVNQITQAFNEVKNLQI